MLAGTNRTLPVSTTGETKGEYEVIITPQPELLARLEKLTTANAQLNEMLKEEVRKNVVLGENLAKVCSELDRRIQKLEKAKSPPVLEQITDELQNRIQQKSLLTLLNPFALVKNIYSAASCLFFSRAPVSAPPSVQLQAATIKPKIS